MRPAYWLPPAVWMAVIMGFSTEGFSAEKTEGFLLPLLRWLLPWATPGQLYLLHALGRMTAHFVEYAILGALWFRAFARGRGLRPWAAGWIALAISVAWGALDEAHQAMTVMRTGSARDVALDAAGALAAVVVARLGWRSSADRATAILLWIAAAGGAGAIAIDAWTGVSPGWLWLTAPAAAATLVVRRVLRSSRGEVPAPPS